MKSRPIELSLTTKFLISIIWDFLDFTIFRIPVVGTITDIISIPLSVYLWGSTGIISSWELIDVTEQVDSEIPTMTIIGIISTLKNKTK